jgi:hypothetical protein
VNDWRLLVDVPARRTASAMNAAQEDGSGFAPDAVVVSTRQVAFEEVEHRLDASRSP